MLICRVCSTRASGTTSRSISATAAGRWSPALDENSSATTVALFLPTTNWPRSATSSPLLQPADRRFLMAASDTKRTDGDSWDLASSVGATATAVAARRAMASKGPNPLIDDPFAEPLVKAVGVEGFIKMMNGDIELGDADPASPAQRLAEGMAVRTRFFDNFFTEAAAAGVRQAVILAAGLDTRAYRLPWPGGPTVYEVDQPQVIEFKSRTLADLGAAPTADRKAVAADLRDDWVTALRDNGFN